MAEYEFPHCNAEVLHAPGTCQYCDMFPDRQAARQASHTPFTPAEANGWGGNVAQPLEHDSVQEAADESVTRAPTPGLGGMPAKPRTNLAPNVLGMKLLVYGSCAGIVLCCLIWIIWVYSQ
jgi:hypothetical protein